MDKNPEGWDRLVMLCRDEKAKIYLFDRVQKMPEPVQREIFQAMELMAQLFCELEKLDPDNWAVKLFKEWK